MGRAFKATLGSSRSLNPSNSDGFYINILYATLRNEYRFPAAFKLSIDSLKPFLF